ncbi:MAG: hypothetical protein U9O94_01115, partial [Nanoarchaeota archaeon]|nr:hypothetical protein [Nanoarchaeota archaeon]
MKYYQGIEEPWKLFNSTEENWRDPKWQRDNAIEDPSTLAKFIHLTINQVKMMDTAIRKGKPMRLLPYTISLMEDNPTNVDSEGKSIDDSVNSIFVEA